MSETSRSSASDSVRAHAGPPVFGRLAVEQRIVGLLAFLGLVHFAWLVTWAALTLDAAALTTLASRPTLELLIPGALVILLGAVVHVSLRLPLLRWPRLDRATGPSPLAAALAGAPSLLVWPLLILRDRRARIEALEARATRKVPDQEVELAFRELLAVPRVAATTLGAWLTLATVVTVVVVSRRTDVPASALTILLTLSLASLLPLISVASSRIRAMLVPEYLTAPRPDPLALPVERSLTLRLGGPASLALLGAVIVPVLVGALWTERLLEIEARDAAMRDALSLLAVAESGDRGALDAMLAQHPERGLVTANERLGTVPAGLDSAEGFVDLDQDGGVDHVVTTGAHGVTRACVPLPPTPSTSTPTWLAMIGLGLVAGLASLVLLLRDVERDLGRASRQVAAVADGEIPEPMAVETFATAELRGLVAGVDRLVGRITDANVHKYVLIEKGHEADRLKSQFLANMSHDLRSPLNSVLGFSELLTTGIEGELAPAQLEMIGTIHRTGKDLLQQIDDILDTAKIEAGRMELHREPTPPATLISRAIQHARVRVGHPIDFDTTFAPGLPPAFVDPYRTTQALENVLMFAAEGLQTGTIEISCVSERGQNGGREIILRIVSPRALVPLAELEQARRGFFRLPGHTGLGLGLPIATSILELQGGELLIEDGSSNSLGARAAMGFELRLPALTARRRARVRLG
ncbi:Signal transduction histidine-protein kinase BarA [Enhygromyxa salina]|uniref:histidine kinase n=1 Tax=Enhygromyxa salina TaxID=215803 RepID=A0A2S9XMV4_9BACT|nr:HAMP domain-containing sensor histidine kinase [Enhygromyxa salina]PRP94183.1 Signal transduction histidine-protein kinase BarA [Enhygromyxa salina]